MKENTKEFHQNEGFCPLLDDPRLYLELEKYVNGTIVTAAIDGTYQCPGETNSAIVTLPQHLQIPPWVSTINPTNLQSLSVFRDYWKRVRENSASHGPHI